VLCHSVVENHSHRCVVIDVMCSQRKDAPPSWKVSAQRLFNRLSILSTRSSAHCALMCLSPVMLHVRPLENNGRQRQAHRISQQLVEPPRGVSMTTFTAVAFSILYVFSSCVPFCAVVVNCAHTSVGRKRGTQCRIAKETRNGCSGECHWNSETECEVSPISESLPEHFFVSWSASPLPSMSVPCSRVLKIQAQRRARRFPSHFPIESEFSRSIKALCFNRAIAEGTAGTRNPLHVHPEIGSRHSQDLETA